MLEAKRTERNLWLKLSGNSLTCHQVGAKFPHTPVVLKPSVGALDCEKIYELGVESAALGKVPNAPTLNAMSAATFPCCWMAVIISRLCKVAL